MKPVRIQRSRQHKMVSPNGLPIVYVGRPTKWGNPFSIKEYGREKALEHYRLWLVLEGRDLVKGINELRGKNLACWCPLDQPCHTDILLEIANS